MRRAGWISGAVGLAGFAALLAQGQPAVAYAFLVVGGLGLSIASRISLNWKIAIGALAGVALGTLPGSGVESVAIVGKAFIAALKMLIAPMILFSVATGIAGMASAAHVGRIGGRTVALYLLTMALAAGTGLVLVNVLEPGAGGSLRETAFFSDVVGSAKPGPTRDLGAFFVEMLFQMLSNPVASLAAGQVLPVVAFAILLGIALLQIGERGEALVELLASANAAVSWILRLFLELAPVGIFALLGQLVATVGFRSLFENLAEFAALVVGATLFHAFVTLPVLARLLTGVSALGFLRAIREAMVVAFSTSSSLATLPVTTRCVEDNLGVPPGISSFVLPLGATVNMDGTALYEAIAAIFVANIYGIDLSLGSQVVIFVVAILTAIGAPGIPSAGMVTMIVVLEAVGLPTESVGLLISIDRLLDTVRTMANVEGDCVVAVAVARAAART
jgi:Na+/H+-dicarboxylate symporter